MKQLCSECAKRPAKFQLSGRRGVRANPEHDLCIACHRAWRNKIRDHEAAKPTVINRRRKGYK